MSIETISPVVGTGVLAACTFALAYYTRELVAASEENHRALLVCYLTWEDSDAYLTIENIGTRTAWDITIEFEAIRGVFWSGPEDWPFPQLRCLVPNDTRHVYIGNWDTDIESSNLPLDPQELIKPIWGTDCPMYEGVATYMEKTRHKTKEHQDVLAVDVRHAPWLGTIVNPIPQTIERSKNRSRQSRVSERKTVKQLQAKYPDNDTGK